MSKFKQIASFQYASEAYLIKAKLESEGIEVLLQNEQTINSDPLLSHAIGGVKLFVYKEDVEKAFQILSIISSYSIDDNGNKMICPKCGSSQILFLTTVTNFKSLVSFIFGLFLNVLPFYTRYMYRCEKCNHQFV